MSKYNKTGCRNCSRREMITKLLQVSAAVVATGSVAGCPGGSKWGIVSEHEGSGAADSTGFDKVHENVRVAAADVPVNTAIELRVGGRNAYLVHLEEERWIAVDRECTHRKCPVNFNEEAVEFHCSCHGSKFSASGEVLKPPAKKPLVTWETRVDGEFVEILAAGKTGA